MIITQRPTIEVRSTTFMTTFACYERILQMRGDITFSIQEKQIEMVSIHY